MTYTRGRRRVAALFMHNPGTIALMSDYGRRARRPNDAPTVLLQGRVSPTARDDVREAAEASGVTMSYYLDALITRGRAGREGGRCDVPVPDMCVPSRGSESSVAQGR